MLDAEFYAFIEENFNRARSIAGPELRRLIYAISNRFSAFEVHEVPSGTKIGTWTVPLEWEILSGEVKVDGAPLFDSSDSWLHFGAHSSAVEKTFLWEDLKSRVYWSERFPDTIPYRTNYYDEDSFSISCTRPQREKMSKSKNIQVTIKSRICDGYLTFGSLFIPGRLEETILISTYCCHQGTGNDNFSGVMTTMMIADYLVSKQGDLKFSFLILFVPETIGALCGISTFRDLWSKIICGFVVSTCGGSYPVAIKRSWNDSHWINDVVVSALNQGQIVFSERAFDIHGSDERQYSSNGSRINCISIFKGGYYFYDEYHSSSDDQQFLRYYDIVHSANLYISTIKSIDELMLYKSNLEFGEVFLKGFIPESHLTNGGFLPGGNADLVEKILMIMFHLDEIKTAAQLAVMCELDESIVSEVLEFLFDRGIVHRL